MAGENRIYINGYLWRNVTNETTAGRVYSLEQVKEIDGNPRRVHEIQADSSDD